MVTTASRKTKYLGYLAFVIKISFTHLFTIGTVAKVIFTCVGTLVFFCESYSLTIPRWDSISRPIASAVAGGDNATGPRRPGNSYSTYINLQLFQISKKMNHLLSMASFYSIDQCWKKHACMYICTTCQIDLLLGA
jgi:hypothetical protein